LVEEIKSLWRALHGLAHDELTLAALETRLAAGSLVTMIAAGGIVAVLLVSAWLGLVGAVVLLLIGIGVTAIIDFARLQRPEKTTDQTLGWTSWTPSPFELQRKWTRKPGAAQNI
jgi:hypothetical protein